MSIFDKINSKTSIGTRLALMSGVFVASSAVVTSLLVGNALSGINFSKKEEAGAHYLPNVWAAVRGNGTLDQQGAAEFGAESAAAAFAAAQSDEERYQAGLTLITAVADGSNLTLDPDLDSFYAMDAATIKIPQLLLAAIELEHATASTNLAERGTLVGVQINRLQSAASAAKSSLEAAMSNNASGETREALAQTISLIDSATANLVARAGGGCSRSGFGARAWPVRGHDGYSVAIHQRRTQPFARRTHFT